MNERNRINCLGTDTEWQKNDRNRFGWVARKTPELTELRTVDVEFFYFVVKQLP